MHYVYTPCLGSDEQQRPLPTPAAACSTPKQQRTAGAQRHQLHTELPPVSWWEPAQPRSPPKGTCWEF